MVLRCWRVLGVALVFLGMAASAQAAGETPQSFADLVAKVMPAVVNVSMTRKASENEKQVGRLPLGPPGSPLDEYFKRFRDHGRPNPGQLPGDEDDGEQGLSAVGSGFIVAADGYVVTNNHVVDQADAITVTLQDGTHMPATLVGKDTKTDLALLKVSAPTPLPFVSFGDSTATKVGDWVIAIGNPFGLGGTVSAGILSARGRDIHAGPFDDFLQINASINQGNSGGPTFNLDGKVIGINTAIYSPNGGSVGIGFAIPADMAKPVIEQLRAQGHVDRGWLGVQIQELTPEIAESLNLGSEHGALIVSVTPDSPAAKAGLRQGDVITHFGGHAVNTLKDLTRAVANTKTSASAPVEIWRNGAAQTVNAVVGTAPEQVQLASATVEKDAPAKNGKSGAAVEVLGLRLVPLTAEARKQLAIPEKTDGVLIDRVANHGAAAAADLRAGDIIVKVGDEAVKKPEEVQHQINIAQATGRKSVLFLISRRGNELFMALTVKEKE